MKYRIFLFISSFLTFSSVYGQEKINIRELDSLNIPLKIKYEGKIVKAVQWNDKLGVNILILTETGIIPTKSIGEGFEDAEIYAYHFLSYKDSIKQTWRVYDFIKNCALDIKTSFLKNKNPLITDLNRDGICEVWIIYTKHCRSDIGPDDMKVIMYQGKKKYAMRGRNRIKIGENIYEGGEYKFDEEFNDSPECFKDFALTLWMENINQN